MLFKTIFQESINLNCWDITVLIKILLAHPHIILVPLFPCSKWLAPWIRKNIFSMIPSLYPWDWITLLCPCLQIDSNLCYPSWMDVVTHTRRLRNSVNVSVQIHWVMCPNTQKWSIKRGYPCHVWQTTFSLASPLPSMTGNKLLLSQCGCITPPQIFDL